jgi:hypothetical protein
MKTETDQLLQSNVECEKKIVQRKPGASFEVKSSRRIATQQQDAYQPPVHNSDDSVISNNPPISNCRRTKERKIGFIIEKVSLWRKLYNGVPDPTKGG